MGSDLDHGLGAARMLDRRKKNLATDLFFDLLVIHIWERNIM